MGRIVGRSNSGSRRISIAALQLRAWCIAITLGASALCSQSALAGRRAPLTTLSLQSSYDREHDPAAAPSQRWLVLRPLAEQHPDTVWGLPRAWLHGLDSLAAIDRIPMPIGGLNIHTPRSSAHISGLLSMNADYPAIGGHVEFDIGLRHYAFTLPSVQVIPQFRGGSMYCAVNLLLVDRRF